MAVRTKGPLPAGWEPRSPKRRAVLADVLERYEQHEREGTLQRGGRGIFYDLRPNGRGRGIVYVKRPEDPSGWWDPDAINRHATRAAAARAGRFGPDEVGPEYVTEVVCDA